MVLGAADVGAAAVVAGTVLAGELHASSILESTKMAIKIRVLLFSV